MFNTPDELLDYMSDFDYIPFKKLMNPIDVYMRGEGSCHDQAWFELAMLSLMNLKPVAGFLIAVDKDNVGGETHSFVYWLSDDGAYWFENAWSDYRGIRRYESELELITFVISAFMKRNPHQYVYLGYFNPKEHLIGEDLDTFVNICMRNAAPWFTWEL